jgi:hypothetical protein
VASKGFSKEYLQKAADPNRVGRYLISVEKAQELLNQIKEGTNYWGKLQNERNTRINKLLSELQENIKDK